MNVLIVKFESELPEEELVRIAEGRAEQFRRIPGLLQKYYVKLDKANHFGGIYVWDSLASLTAYRDSDLASSLPETYRMTGPPTIEIMETVGLLRDPS